MVARDVIEQVRAVLLRHWDPIGVVDEPTAQDEYDSYAPGVARLVLANATTETIMRHLIAIEREQMGLPGNETVAREAVDLLVGLRQS